MKIQGLAVIAMIIIVPMAILLNSYATNQIKTLQLQISYDSKLQSATYDGIKAFQMNMSNSTTSDLANSKMRDIKASIKTFYNSLASHFDMAGYGEDVLKEYVPAIVYTLYDGYYIYSAYDNKLDPNDIPNFYPQSSYTDGEQLSGLKPYIYYSCRYKNYPASGDDFVITYSLDTYITIQGMINGEAVNDSGYLLTGVNKSGDKYYYRGVEILSREDGANLKQNVYLPSGNATLNVVENLECMKVNGAKYYRGSDDKVFTMINDQSLEQSDVSAERISNNTTGRKFYEDAYEFRNRILTNYNLGDLSSAYAVDMKGNPYSGDNNPYPIERKVFEELNSSSSTYIEDENSNFNVHKTEVIKNVIETNLMTAIENYNAVSTSDVNFQMPKLKDSEWENITSSISMITFLQGLSIGGKVYNGYAIVQNNVNDDYVSEDSIYIAYTYNGEYYRPTDRFLTSVTDLTGAVGMRNTEFERKAIMDNYKDPTTDVEMKRTVYYYPRGEYASYSSIINFNSLSNSERSAIEYFKGVNITDSIKYQLAQIYYTALGRERYGMYRVMNDLTEVQEYLRDSGD